jgi:hypothetical protein
MIRDGAIQIRAGFAEEEIEKAQAALQRYRNRSMSQWQRTIYFVTCAVENFPVKIGMAVDMDRRLENLRTALPFDVVLLASKRGTAKDEAALHKQFEHLRLRGEWFRRERELMEFVERVGWHGYGAERVPFGGLHPEISMA